MRFAFVTLLTVFSSAIPISLAYTWGFPYESQKVRGVNLGGWLVLEVGDSSCAGVFLGHLLTRLV